MKITDFNFQSPVDFPKNAYRWHPAISEWMYLVESGKFPTSQEQKQLMVKVRKDLEHSDVIIKHDKIEKCIERSERYFFTINPYQRFFYAFAFGVYIKREPLKNDERKFLPGHEDENGYSLLYDEYLFLAGRGTGKNGTLSAMAFNLVDVNHVKNYDIDIVATSEDQAMTSFDEVYELIDDSKKLQKHWKHTKKVITHNKTKSKIKYKTSNAKTKDGLRSGTIVFDEIHEFLSEELINVFSSALGKKPYARTFYLTTDGYVRGGFLDTLKGIAKQVLDGEFKKLALFPFIFKLDHPDEVHNEINWLKAIPMLAYSNVLLERVRKEYVKALETPSLMIEFLTKRMNIPAQDAFEVVAKWEDIQKTGDKEMPDLTGKTCSGAAVDFADKRDFVSCGLLFWDENGKDRYFIQHSFIRREVLNNQNFKFPIQQAVDEGLATIIDEPTIDPSIPAKWFAEQRKKYIITNVAADSFKIDYLRKAFDEESIPLEQVRSGTWTDTKLGPTVDDMFVLGSIHFGKDFMMRWYTNNTYIKYDGKGNRAYEKIEPKLRKTDGFHCLLHALKIEKPYEPPFKYQSQLKTYNY